MSRRSDTVDWEQIGRPFYVLDLTRSSSWIRAADELLAAAAALEPKVLSWWERMEADDPDAIGEHNFQAIHLMLFGFAVENLCKSALVQYLSPDEMDKARAGTLPDRLRTHQLVELARSIKFTVNLEDEDLLRRMERAAVWHGRYPVPVSHARSNATRFLDGNVYSTSWTGGKDVARLKNLIARLRAHIADPMTLRAIRSDFQARLREEAEK